MSEKREPRRSASWNSSWLAAAMNVDPGHRHRRHAAGVPGHRSHAAHRHENHVQWIVTAYMAGFGVRTASFGADVGPLRQAADIGRRTRSLCFGGAARRSREQLSRHSSFGASSMASRARRRRDALGIRDLYSGRQMARVMSLTFMVFLTVPILATEPGCVHPLAGGVAL